MEEKTYTIDTVITLQEENRRFIIHFDKEQNQYLMDIEVGDPIGSVPGLYKRFSKENLAEEIANQKEQGYMEFRNVEEVSWYATVANNTPYEEKWKKKDGMLIPIESHSVGITTFQGNSYKSVDEWEVDDETYLIGRATDDETFFYARVVSTCEDWHGKYAYEFEHHPTRKEVEDTYLNDISMRELDALDAEYGADGRRFFPNLNKSERITLHLQYREPVVINGWKSEKDTITFDDMEQLETFVQGEVAYNHLDDTVRTNQNEILLYAETESGKVIWGTKNTEIGEETPVLSLVNDETKSKVHDELANLMYLMIETDLRCKGKVTEDTLQVIAVQGYAYKDGVLTKLEVPRNLVGETRPVELLHLSDGTLAVMAKDAGIQNYEKYEVLDQLRLYAFEFLTKNPKETLETAIKAFQTAKEQTEKVFFSGKESCV